MATDSGLSVLAWAQERHDNSVQIASTKTGGDRVGWLEDVTYWTAIIDALSENERLRIACASGWGEPVLVNTLRAERDAARAEVAQARAELDALRELLNVHNLGGWTDAVEPMRRALQAEAALAEARLVLREVEPHLRFACNRYAENAYTRDEKAASGRAHDLKDAIAAVLAQEEK